MFHLRYHPMGCKEAFPLAKKSAHERDCPFLQLKCPFHGQCAFNGALADVVPHLAAEHQVCTEFGGKFETAFSLLRSDPIR